jgi:hypothetical protein
LPIGLQPGLKGRISFKGRFVTRVIVHGERYAKQEKFYGPRIRAHPGERRNVGKLAKKEVTENTSASDLMFDSFGEAKNFFGPRPVHEPDL